MQEVNDIIVFAERRMQMKVGVIGYGSMGKMLLEKLPSNSNLVDGKLYVANRNYDKIVDLNKEYNVCQSN
jgi:pyrroline-5-carboxylate reductase